MSHYVPREGDSVSETYKQGGWVDCRGVVRGSDNREVLTNRGVLVDDRGTTRPADDVRR